MVVVVVVVVVVGRGERLVDWPVIVHSCRTWGALPVRPTPTISGTLKWGGVKWLRNPCWVGDLRAGFG